MYYLGVQDVLSAPPGFTNVILNISRLSVLELGFGDELSENGRMLMIQPVRVDEGHRVQNFQAWSTGVGPISEEAFNSK